MCRNCERRLNKSRQHDNNDEVVITCGTMGAITLALQAILNPGDEILLFDPYFVAYPQLATLMGAQARFISIYPDFQPDPDESLSITPEPRPSSCAAQQTPLA
ncbi:MAG: aminotransferase class I/II-fold pyridoxal phosphate-dependent enzyme [Gemmatales bacterium]